MRISKPILVLTFILLTVHVLYWLIFPAFLTPDSWGHINTVMQYLQTGMWVHDPFQTPGYGIFLTLLFYSFDPNLSLVTLFQHILLVGACAHLALIVSNSLGQMPAIVLGLIIGIHPIIAIQSGSLMTEGLLIPLIILIAIYLTKDCINFPDALVLGAIGSYLALVRPNALVVIVIILFSRWVCSKREEKLNLIPIGMISLVLPLVWSILQYESNGNFGMVTAHADKLLLFQSLQNVGGPNFDLFEDDETRALATQLYQKGNSPFAKNSVDTWSYTLQLAERLKASHPDTWQRTFQSYNFRLFLKKPFLILSDAAKITLSHMHLLPPNMVNKSTLEQAVVPLTDQRLYQSVWNDPYRSKVIEMNYPTEGFLSKQLGEGFIEFTRITYWLDLCAAYAALFLIIKNVMRKKQRFVFLRNYLVLVSILLITINAFAYGALLKPLDRYSSITIAFIYILLISLVCIERQKVTASNPIKG